jgi:hypothetical protein
MACQTTTCSRTTTYGLKDMSAYGTSLQAAAGHAPNALQAYLRNSCLWVKVFFSWLKHEGQSHNHTSQHLAWSLSCLFLTSMRQ